MLTIMPVTKQQLFELVGGGPSAVARIFKVRPQAVSQWPDPIPESRVFELRGRHPELFVAPAVPAPIESVQEAA